MADNREIAYVEDGMVVIRGSALGACPRNLWGALMGIDGEAPPAHFNMESAAKEGWLHEEEMRKDLLDNKARFEEGSDQYELELVIIPGKLIIRGHCDGIMLGAEGGRLYLWEAKSVSDDRWKTWQTEHLEGFELWRWQISAYMYALAPGGDGQYQDYLPCWLSVKNRNSGVREHGQVMIPPVTFDEIKAKAMTIFKAFKSEEMPDCDPKGGRYPCARYFLHDEDDGEQVDIVEAVNEVAEEYYEVAAKLKKLSARKKELRDLLIKTTGADGSVDTGSYKVTASSSDREGLNKDTVREALGDDFTRHVTRTPVTTLRVTRKKGRG